MSNRIRHHVAATEFKRFAEGQEARIVSVGISSDYDRGIDEIVLQLGDTRLELWAHGVHTEGWIICDALPDEETPPA